MDTKNELKIIPINSIKVNERFRKDFGSDADWEEFKKDIEENGLISAIAVKRIGDSQYELLAGERRLTACKELGWTEINATIYTGEVDELDMIIIELAENLKRKNMTIEEETKGKKKYLELMQQKYGKKELGRSSGVSLRDAAKMLNVSSSSLSDDITIAEAMDVMPEIKKAKSKSEAIKLIRKNLRKLHEYNAVKEFEKEREKRPEMNPEDYLIDNYHIGDFFEGIKQVADGIVDLIEIDPPYAIDLKNIKKGASLTKDSVSQYNEVADDEYEDFMRRTLKEAYRVAKQDAWLILWFAHNPWFEKMFQWATEAGWQGSRNAAIWFKMMSGQTNQPDLYLGSAYEMFFYLRKGNATINFKGTSNVFQFPPVPGGKKVHPTERPIGLMEKIISTFIRQGGLVLVPFAGSGNTLIAADKWKCKAFGYDLTEDYKNSFIVKVKELYK